jgi:hypothetical protein
MTHGLRRMPVERRCVCFMHSRPWWQHTPACDDQYRARFFNAVRSLRMVASSFESPSRALSGNPDERTPDGASRCYPRPASGAEPACPSVDPCGTGGVASLSDASDETVTPEGTA